jgi:hypothetical protein
MSEIVADPPNPSCYLLFSGPGIEELQRVGPDPFPPRARGGKAFRQGKLRQPARPATRHSQSQTARARSWGPAAQGGGAVRSDRPQGLICCGLSLRNSCRRRSLRSTRPSVSGSTCHRCPRSRISGRRYPLSWRRSRTARSALPRSRASPGGCVRGCWSGGSRSEQGSGDRRSVERVSAVARQDTAASGVVRASRRAPAAPNRSSA